MWHSDSSFRKVPSFVSIMSVYEVPKQGGETEYVSARVKRTQDFLMKRVS